MNGPFNEKEKRVVTWRHTGREERGGEAGSAPCNLQLHQPAHVGPLLLLKYWTTISTASQVQILHMQYSNNDERLKEKIIDNFGIILR